MEESGDYSYEHIMGPYIREQKESLDWKPYKNGYIFFLTAETFTCMNTWNVVAMMERIKHQDGKKIIKMKKKMKNVEFLKLFAKKLEPVMEFSSHD